MKTKKKKTSTATLKKKLWDIFSEYIRRRDALKFSGGDIVKCITCSHMGHWKTFDCGHGISRRHLATMFDERNNHAQCKGCNGFGSGKQFEYMLEVDRIYGEGTSLKLLNKSKGQMKLMKFEYEELIEKYNAKLKELL